MPVVTNIDDLREMAQKRVARAIFEYVDRGAYTECTLRANRADIEAIGLRQRVGIDVDRRSTKTTMLGREVTMPVALAPVGLLGLNWANGEILAARAAHKALAVKHVPLQATVFGAPHGVERLATVCREVSIPVLAIGGITMANASACFAAGASGIAAIRLFQDAQDISSLVQSLRKLGR